MTGVCRVTVATPGERLDVCLPQGATIGELLPQLRIADGWTLARLDGVPLPPALTVAGAGIVDGEVLYSQPLGGLPLFVEGTAESSVRSRQWTALLLAALAIVGATFAFPPLIVMVSALVAAGVLARVLRENVSASVVALCGLPAAVLEARFIGVLVYALAAAILVRKAAWPAGAVLAAGAGTAIAFRPAAAPFVVASALLLTPLLPIIAARMGGLPAPAPPADPDALRSDDAPAPGPEVAASALAAGQTLTGLLAGVAAVAAIAAFPTFGAGAPLAIACGLTLVLRARAYAGAGQKAVLLAGAAAVLVPQAVVGDPLIVVYAILATGLGGLLYATRNAAVPPSPYWARLLDIADYAALISLLPLSFAAANLYAVAAG